MLAAMTPEDQPDDDDEPAPGRLEWDFHLAAAQPSSSSTGASDAIGAIDFDPSARHLATAGIARKIRFYHFAALSNNAMPLVGCICAPAKLSSVRWRNGAVAGCGDYDGVVTEYDAERCLPVAERDEHSGRRVWSVDYSPDGNLAASGADDRTAHLWDPRGGGTAAAVISPGAAVLCVEFDPSGRPYLAVGCADRTAHVYDVRSVAAGPVTSVAGRHRRAVTYVRFPGTEGRLLTSAADGTHRMWELGVTSRHVRKFAGHVSGQRFVGMGVWRGGGLMASGSETDEVFVYDLRWGMPVWRHRFGAGDGDGDGRRGGMVSAVTWRQGDGDGVLVAGGSDGTIKVFTCTPAMPHPCLT